MIKFIKARLGFYPVFFIVNTDKYCRVVFRIKKVIGFWEPDVFNVELHATKRKAYLERPGKNYNQHINVI